MFFDVFALKQLDEGPGTVTGATVTSVGVTRRPSVTGVTVTDTGVTTAAVPPLSMTTTTTSAPAATVFSGIYSCTF
jgi:hypothetical protein